MKVLFEAKEVKELLEAYQKMMGVRIAVLDRDFRGLYSSQYGISDFCSFIRKCAAVNSACMTCDIDAFKRTKSEVETYVYKCHLGLYEAITPIMDKQQILGYVMIGQILGYEDKDRNWSYLEKRIKAFGLEPFAYQASYYELRQMTMEEIDASIKIMKACASTIWLRYIVDIERSPITERINAYIEENYTQPLDILRICMDLNVSRTTIYNYMKREHDLSFTRYLNQFRLERSLRLLTETDLAISEVALSVGIDNYNYYSRLFRKVYDMTPTRYRLVNSQSKQKA